MMITLYLGMMPWRLVDKSVINKDEESIFHRSVGTIVAKNYRPIQSALFKFFISCLGLILVITKIMN
jgi:hypothetical protein